MLLGGNLSLGFLNSKLDARNGTLASVKLNTVGKANAVLVTECGTRNSEDEMLLEDLGELRAKENE